MRSRNRSTILGVRLSPDERRRVDAAAVQAGERNTSRWARWILLRLAPKARKPGWMEGE